MNQPLSDTDAQTEAVLLQMLRDAPVWQKWQRVGQLNAMAKSLVLSGLRQQYPHANENELRRRLADRLLGSELALAAYGPLLQNDIDE